MGQTDARTLGRMEKSTAMSPLTIVGRQKLQFNKYLIFSCIYEGLLPIVWLLHGYTITICFWSTVKYYTCAYFVCAQGVISIYNTTKKKRKQPEMENAVNTNLHKNKQKNWKNHQEKEKVEK